MSFNTLAVRIKEQRKKRGYSQQEMASMLGMTRSNFGSYEIGRIQPPSMVLEKIADLLDTSTDYLLGKTESSLPSDAEERFVDSLDLADEDIIAKFNLKLDGRALSPEQIKMTVAFLRSIQG